MTENALPHLSGNPTLVIGVDVGGTQLRAVVADQAGSILRRLVTETRAGDGREAVLNRIRTLIHDVSQGWDPGAIHAVGVGVPGPTDPYAGLVVVAPNIPGWTHVNLHQELGADGIWPIHVGNDANLACLAEHRFGAGQGCRDMLYLTISTGIGGGVIVNNQMLLGVRGFAAEVGHMTIEARPEPDTAGRLGTLEDLAAGPGIARSARLALAQGGHSLLEEWVGSNLEAITPQLLTKAAEAGDTFSLEQFHQAAYYLGVGVTNLLHIFNPQRIVIGGGVWLHARHLLRDTLWATIRDRAKSPDYWNHLEILTAQLGDDAGLLGAVALAVNELDRKQKENQRK